MNDDGDEDDDGTVGLIEYSLVECGREKINGDD
jgi:hypothetical protein